MTKLTKFLVKRRKELKITQKLLSNELGLKSHMSLSNIERGLTELPPVYFEKVAHILGEPVSLLISLAILDYRDWLDEVVHGE